MGSKALWIPAGLLAAAAMAGQVPESERIPVTDPEALAKLGFPTDAKGVFVRTKLADPGMESAAWKATETWGPALGETTVAAYELEGFHRGITIRTLESAWCDNPYVEPDHSARARLHVPDGAELLELQVWAYDDQPDHGVNVQVWESCQAEGLEAPELTLLGTWDTLGAIGYYYGGVALDGVTVNNRDCTYALRVAFAPNGVQCFTDSLQFHKFKALWRRQVSPAPASSTFSDVPTGHPFFQFIEALSKAGITGGCGNGNFCPDQALNRGQMAVFLAKALGLQWP
jgi:hypothetical protein